MLQHAYSELSSYMAKINKNPVYWTVSVIYDFNRNVVIPDSGALNRNMPLWGFIWLRKL
jgi:hypothetical protein